jgi:glycosyltransferase involved in cell wall biosynthesis
MIRILHAIAEMGVGGAESMVVELVHGGSSIGWESAIASAGGVREQELVEAGFRRCYRVRATRRQVGRTLASAWDLRGAINDFKPDVVFAHNVGATAVAYTALLLTPSRAPLITVFHGVAADDFRVARMVLDALPNLLVSVSDATLRRLREAGLSRRDACVIRNAVTPLATVPRERARAVLNIGGDTPLALCVARLVKQKRHDVLLDAWSRLPEAATLLLVGDGDRREACEDLAAALGLRDRVHFLGMRRDMDVLLGAADVLVLSSDWEGLPMAVLEAMAAGVSVVATEVDGVREIVEPGEGILVPPGDASALSKALATLLFEPELRATMSEAAAVGVRRRYDPPHMMGSYRGLVCRAMSHHRRAGDHRVGDA